MEHEWHTCYMDERTYKEVACCYNCDVEVMSPHDLHMIDGCPPVEMFTPEWCRLMGIMSDCDLQFILKVHES